ncbi:MAG: NUDIX domain-containing protein [Candidatus Magasanikbacteria bacterium]|nr:NUDIX domain-containing protein [Candidatus Magasanikbacteria bacterium]
MDIELLDVLNEKGEPTGEVRSRDECHRLGLRHRVVHIWIITPNGKILIQRRSAQRPERPGEWGVGSAAGHVPHQQTSQQAAAQETQEELGLSVTPQELAYFDTLHRNRDAIINQQTFHYRHIADIYLYERPLTLDQIHPNSEEVAEVQLIPYPKLEKIVRSGDPTFAPSPIEYEKIFALLHARFPNQ